MSFFRRIKAVFFISLSVFLYTPAGYSKMMSASELLSHCQAKPNQNKPLMHNLKQGMRFSFCSGYILGMVDGYTITRDVNKRFCKCSPDCLVHKIACIPKTGLQVGRIMDAFAKYLQEDPGLKNGTARLAVLMTLSKMYPCKKK